MSINTEHLTDLGKGIKPGWVLALVIVMLGTFGFNYLEAKDRSRRLLEFFTALETNRSAEMLRAVQIVEECNVLLGKLAEESQDHVLKLPVSQ